MGKPVNLSASDFTALAAWPVLIKPFDSLESFSSSCFTHVLIWVKLVRTTDAFVHRHSALGIAVTSPGLANRDCHARCEPRVRVGVWLRGLVTGPDQPVLTVLYDGACPRCRASVALVMAG